MDGEGLGKKGQVSLTQLCTPVTPNLWEAEVGGLQVQGRPQKLSERPCLKIFFLIQKDGRFNGASVQFPVTVKEKVKRKIAR